MKVLETQLPGVGTRYKLVFQDGGSFTILLHNDGKRETYWSGRTDTDSEQLFTLTESEARKLAEIFDGTYFEPVPDNLENVLEEARIRWIAVPADSPVIGNSIRDEEIRTKTNASIIAIQRGEKTFANPSPDTRLERDDVLVVAGAKEAHEALEAILRGK